MTELIIMNQFTSLISPLIPKGKFAIEFVGQPEREEEQELQKHIVIKAKQIKAHRQTYNALGYLKVSFSPGSILQSGPFMVLHVHKYKPNIKKRIVIILGFLVVLFVIYIFNTR